MIVTFPAIPLGLSGSPKLWRKATGKIGTDAPIPLAIGLFGLIPLTSIDSEALIVILPPLPLLRDAVLTVAPSSTISLDVFKLKEPPLPCRNTVEPMLAGDKVCGSASTSFIVPETFMSKFPLSPSGIAASNYSSG
ncbi:MAG: hypothetical protein AAFR37_10110, partial [Cyanobacteria bacterium J06628_3]